MSWDDMSNEAIDKRISLIEAEKLESRINETTENGASEELSDLLYEAAYTGLYVDCCFCNSWADMGPLISDNKISLISPKAESPTEWQARNNLSSRRDKNPLRAAAIVYLMMNGVKAEDCK